MEESVNEEKEEKNNEPVKKHQIRKNFEGLADFQVGKRTNKDGKVEIEFQLTDSLSKFKIFSVVSDQKNRFGIGKEEIITELPISMRVSTVNHLNYQDNTEIEIQIENKCAKIIKTKLAIKIKTLFCQGVGKGGEKNILEFSNKKQKIAFKNLEIKKIKKIKIPIKTTGKIGKCEIEIILVENESNKYLDSQSVPLEVKNPFLGFTSNKQITFKQHLMKSKSEEYVDKIYSIPEDKIFNNSTNVHIKYYKSPMEEVLTIADEILFNRNDNYLNDDERLSKLILILNYHHFFTNATSKQSGVALDIQYKSSSYWYPYYYSYCRYYYNHYSHFPYVHSKINVFSYIKNQLESIERHWSNLSMYNYCQLFHFISLLKNNLFSSEKQFEENFKNFKNLFEKSRAKVKSLTEIQTNNAILNHHLFSIKSYAFFTSFLFHFGGATSSPAPTFSKYTQKYLQELNRKARVFFKEKNYLPLECYAWLLPIFYHHAFPPSSPDYLENQEIYESILRLLQSSVDLSSPVPNASGGTDPPLVSFSCYLPKESRFRVYQTPLRSDGVIFSSISLCFPPPSTGSLHSQFTELSDSFFTSFFHHHTFKTLNANEKMWISLALLNYSNYSAALSSQLHSSQFNLSFWFNNICAADFTLDPEGKKLEKQAKPLNLNTQYVTFLSETEFNLNFPLFYFFTPSSGDGIGSEPRIMNFQVFKQGYGSGTIEFQLNYLPDQLHEIAELNDRGITIQRTYESHASNSKNSLVLDPVEASVPHFSVDVRSRILVSLYLTLAQEVEHLVLTDRLPAGFEAENPIFKTMPVSLDESIREESGALVVIPHYYSIWDNLPNEILFHIFSFLSIPDLLNAALVCRRFYTHCNDEQFWSSLLRKSQKLQRNSKQLAYILDINRIPTPTITARKWWMTPKMYFMTYWGLVKEDKLKFFVLGKKYEDKDVKTEWVNRQNIRMDVVECYASKLKPGRYKYQYVARANKVGNFTAFPASAQLLYQQNICCNTTPSVFNII